MAAYVPKDWNLDDPITDTALEHIEYGIAGISVPLCTQLTYMHPTDTGVTVVANINDYRQPATPIVVFSFTAPADTRLVFFGFVTLKHSVATGTTPDLSWAIKNASGTNLVVGPVANRSRENANQPVDIPIAGSINLTANQNVSLRLAVSASTAGTVTVVGGGRTYATGILLPR